MEYGIWNMEYGMKQWNRKWDGRECTQLQPICATGTAQSRLSYLATMSDLGVLSHQRACLSKSIVSSMFLCLISHPLLLSS